MSKVMATAECSKYLFPKVLTTIQRGYVIREVLTILLFEYLEWEMKKITSPNSTSALPAFLIFFTYQNQRSFYT